MRQPGGTAKKCAICGRPVEERYKPFCSSRCANIDLGRWLNEGYRIPARPDPDEDEEAERPPDDAGTKQ